MASIPMLLWRRIFLMSALGLSGTAMAQSASPPTANYLRTNQVVVAVTGTAVQFPKYSGLNSGVIVCAFGGYSTSVTPSQHVNANAVTISSPISPATPAVNACDGTTSGANGDCIAPGACRGYAVNDSSLLWLNGVAGDGVSFSGN